MVNSLGATIIFDGQVPRTFTALARTTISGGQLVVSSGAANVVGSGANTYVTGDVTVDLLQNSDMCNGMALYNAASGAYVTVATRGAYLMRCAGVVSGGAQVCPVSGTLQGVISMPFSGTGTSGTTGYSSPWLANTPVGRAITASASGTDLYALVSLNV
jgi:hypothetical protein